jgi:hypothetical protein
VTPPRGALSREWFRLMWFGSIPVPGVLLSEFRTLTRVPLCLVSSVTVWPERSTLFVLFSMCDRDCVVGVESGWDEATFDLLLFVACAATGLAFLYLAARRYQLRSPLMPILMPSLYGASCLCIGFMHLTMVAADSSVVLALKGTPPSFALCSPFLFALSAERLAWVTILGRYAGLSAVVSLISAACSVYSMPQLVQLNLKAEEEAGTVAVKALKDRAELLRSKQETEVFMNFVCHVMSCNPSSPLLSSPLLSSPLLSRGNIKTGAATRRVTLL